MIDDDTPIVSMVENNGTSPENTSNPTFELTATGLTTTTNVAILAIISEDGGDFIKDLFEDSTVAETVSFSDPDGDNVYSGNIRLIHELDNDNTAEMNGPIKMTLIENGAKYRLGEITVGRLTILDNDSQPTVSIKADQGSIIENEGPPTFEISATGIYTDSTLEIKANCA